MDVCAYEFEKNLRVNIKLSYACVFLNCNSLLDNVASDYFMSHFTSNRDKS